LVRKEGGSMSQGRVWKQTELAILQQQPLVQ
jgi:hypothetical protein